MKTIFVINPKAGNGKNIEKLKKSILDAAEHLKVETEMYITKSVGDAREFVKKYCEKYGATRFIACGGDGTLSEIVNGAIGCENAEVGVIPVGTGNDFCRNFDCSSDFFDVLSQLRGKSVKCDAIHYRTYVNGIEKSGYSVNMFNIGFDCNVADMTDNMKKKPFISGSLAYFLSIFAILIKKKGENLSIDIDRKRKHTGKLLLISIANGRYCGGGVMSNPLACVTDGYMNVNIVRNMSRLNFLTKLPYYMNGTHIKKQRFKKLIFNTNCKSVSITPQNGVMRLCIDGEITDAGKTDFKIVHNAFNFVIPNDMKVNFLESAEQCKVQLKYN